MSARLVHISPAVQSRGYGEHWRLDQCFLMLCGSAPWIRGTQYQSFRHLSYFRFSPVDTGNTIDYLDQGELKTVQPRGYGEHLNTHIIGRSVRGSAPWIRGTLMQKSSEPQQRRFSPVDTGNTERFD